MSGKRILGIAFIVIGAAMLFFSDYIAVQVAEGKLKIERAQSTVDSAESIFSKSQYTKPVGKVIFGGAQKKIDQGRVEVSQYEALSNNLKIAGIVLIVVGAGLLLLGQKNRR